MKWFDLFAEHTARSLARRLSRRSFLGTVGVFIAGSATIPLLPVARGQETKPAANGAHTDPASCDYWRHCAIDGFLCGCCGGSATSCPPGTDMSAITWVGTCHNASDGKDYVISYNDCCGKTSCGRCFCNRNEGDTPLYEPGHSNDYDWCSGNSKANVPYHCSTARIVGAAQ
jgi:methylamine dehydrogenase light chain